MPRHLAPRSLLRPALAALFVLGFAPRLIAARAEPPAPPDSFAFLGRAELRLDPGAEIEWPTLPQRAGAILQVQIDIPQFDLLEGEAIEVSIAAQGQRAVAKTLSAGDPSLFVPVRVIHGGPARIKIRSSAPRALPIRVALIPLPTDADGAAAFEAEPNNAWTEAQPMRIGRPVWGNGDDVDYLDNKDEKPVKNYANGLDNPVRDRPGLDWFRFDWTGEPRLVLFELDVLDRDVSVNLRMYAPKKDGSDVELYLDGKDPMEIIHDREPERYSKSISRVLKPGTYYLQVNGNHPRYILRSKIYPLPPYADAADAVRVGAHYVMNVGDAWLAQVPREGNVYRRVQNMHETALRCTACHPSIFSTESVLTARKAGYPIEAKSALRYVVDRIYNGPQPLYGPAGVNWQRYIAIPMQSQGKHGGILMDYERWVSRRETPFFLRYAPFLRLAWDAPMADLVKTHIDEQNGVVPADSNIGYATRDWRVLTEAFRRTGDRSYEAAADNARAFLLRPDADRKNIQDRIHAVWALSMMGGPERAGDLAAAIDDIMKLQNADGGWPDQADPGRASAVYTTGQVVWTLTQAGRTLENLPALRKADDYILSQQQTFGGWFQTTTHENFQTPMRETRYAVMALAATHPLDADSKPGWGNRDGGEARAPRADTLLHTLDDLDNLWDVPDARAEELTGAILPLLASPQPLVRAAAAETLGRLGTPSAIKPIAALLGDPVKDVWRAAAWSLRQFGNRGEGIEAIQAALADADPARRRGAARVFAYQFYGMTERLDLAAQVMKLTADANLWTRLESLRTLRQWFYRTGEDTLRREIVDLYIDRMAVPEHPAIRTNLAQGMYIMLDENEAGGVSIERNIANFPFQRDRDAVIDARRHVEQSTLLEPVLTALADGNELQRDALLASFDGSFFAGRFYARNPRAMIDVGNDREFGFYHQPPQRTLDRAFKALLAAKLPAADVARTIDLASFFFVPRDTADPELQLALLDVTASSEKEIREAALRAARESLAMKGADANPALTARLGALIKEGDDDRREALLVAARRNDALLHAEPLASYIRALPDDPKARRALMTVIDTDLIPDDKALAALEDEFTISEKDEARLAVVDRLFARAAMTDVAAPSRELVRLLRALSVDATTAVRERLMERLEKTERLRASPRLATVFYGGLSDSSPGIRLRCLKLALEQEGFWRQAETAEYVLKLLVDPDGKIRAQALAAVEKFGLLAAEPRYSRRVKTLASDAALGSKARALLVASGRDPEKIEPDGAVQSFGVPDLDIFRDKVNRYLYKEGADGHSCVDCHQNHSILRIAGMPLGATELPEDLLIQNMNSALKVVNLSDPEQSLILRKPRSPQGQGEAPPDSPTGLVHVGGPRWASTADPAYQAFLGWIRDAATSARRRAGVAVRVDSYSPDYPAAYALDGDPSTIWHTEFVGAAPPFPHEIVVDLGAPTDTSALQYVPRQESSNGRVRDWEIYASADGEAWGEPLARGQWTDDAAAKIVPVRARGVRYVKLRGLASTNGQPFMSAAEVIVLRARGGTE